MITPVENGSTCSGAQPSAGQRHAAGMCRGQAGLAGAGVGIAGVDQHRADRSIGQMLAANLHRRRAEAVLREHAGDLAVVVSG